MAAAAAPVGQEAPSAVERTLVVVVVVVAVAAVVSFGRTSFQAAAAAAVSANTAVVAAVEVAAAEFSSALPLGQEASVDASVASGLWISFVYPLVQ